MKACIRTGDNTNNIYFSKDILEYGLFNVD